VPSAYQSNIIVQNGNSEVAVKAAQALANKHPESSIIVRFDADGNLITPTDGFYTPKGNVRLSFVDHGADLSKEGAQSLADKVKILQQTYGNDGTDIQRIALVGCNTDGIDQNLTQDLAKAIYNDTPELRTAEITGRKGDMQINPDGTKTD
jgi:RTX toxin RtxA